METIITIIIVLSLEYFYDDINKYRKDIYFLNIFETINNKIDGDRFEQYKVYIFYSLSMLVSLMILLSFLDYISELLSFIVSLILLIFSLRTNQFNRSIEELKIKIEFKNSQVDKELLYSICPNLKQTRAKNNIHQLIIKNLFFNSVRNTFSIIFYFLLMGAPGAIAYKLLDSIIYSGYFKVDATNKAKLKNYMYIIDYLPIRLTSYCFSIVSNYDEVIKKMNDVKLSSDPYTSNIEFINQIGESVYDSHLGESDQIVQIQNILSRTLIAWLSITLLMALAGVLI